MQVHMNESDYKPFFITLAEWLVRRNQVMSSSAGGPKMQEARHEGYTAGRREMMCEMLAHEVNRRRIEMFFQWKQVPIENSIGVRRLLTVLENAYESCHELADANKVNGAKVVNWEKFETEVENILNVTAISREMLDQETERHRKAVLDGYEQPNAGDVAWLTEEEGKKADEIRRLRKLAMTAEKSQATGV